MPKSDQDNDVISRVADAGEYMMRRLFSLPRRIVAGTLDEASHVLHGAATMLGRADPLDSRLTALEKRLDSLEKPAPTRSGAATRANPAEHRREPGRRSGTRATRRPSRPRRAGDETARCRGRPGRHGRTVRSDDGQGGALPRPGRRTLTAGRTVSRSAPKGSQKPAVAPRSLRGEGSRAWPEDVLAAPEAEQVVDGVLAGALPEAVARSLVEHRVVERVVTEALARAELEGELVYRTRGPGRGAARRPGSREPGARADPGRRPGEQAHARPHRPDGAQPGVHARADAHPVERRGSRRAHGAVDVACRGGGGGAPRAPAPARRCDRPRAPALVPPTAAAVRQLRRDRDARPGTRLRRRARRGDLPDRDRGRRVRRLAGVGSTAGLDRRLGNRRRRPALRGRLLRRVLVDGRADARDAAHASPRRRRLRLGAGPAPVAGARDRPRLRDSPALHRLPARSRRRPSPRAAGLPRRDDRRCYDLEPVTQPTASALDPLRQGA